MWIAFLPALFGSKKKRINVQGVSLVIDQADLILCQKETVPCGLSHLQQQIPLSISSPPSLPSARISSRLVPLNIMQAGMVFVQKEILLAHLFKVMYLVALG